MILILLAWQVANASAADWPHRTGPYRNGSTTEIVAPWNEPLVASWSLPMGEGSSSPVVARGRLFVHSKVQDKQEEEIMAFDAASGEKLWRVSYPRATYESSVGNGPRASPTIALGRVYAYGVTGILTCLKADTGELLWQTNPLENLKAPGMQFGATAAPLIDGNRLYLPIGAADAGLVALDADDGKVIWRTKVEPPTSAGPVLHVSRAPGEPTIRELIYVSTRGPIGVDPHDGRVLWEFPLAEEPIGTLPPIVSVGNRLVASSMVTGTVGFQVRTHEGVGKAFEIWRNPLVTCYFSQAVAVGREHPCLYIVNATLIPEAEIGLSCLDVESGRELWSKPKIGVYNVSMICTGDEKLLVLDDIHGDLVLLDANRDEYRELSRSHVCNPTIISPALAGGRLYVRDNASVRCLPLPTNDVPLVTND